MSIRAGCCGKKRKSSQLKWIEGYDGGSWRCKEGYGCRKPKKCNKPHVVCWAGNINRNNLNNDIEQGRNN